MNTWKPGDRVQWNPLGRAFAHPTTGTVIGPSGTSGQVYVQLVPRPAEPYYVVQLDEPVNIGASGYWPPPETPLIVTELRVLGSALEAPP